MFPLLEHELLDVEKGEEGQDCSQSSGHEEGGKLVLLPVPLLGQERNDWSEAADKESKAEVAERVGGQVLGGLRVSLFRLGFHYLIIKVELQDR